MSKQIQSKQILYKEFKALNYEEKEKFIKKLNKTEARFIYSNPDFFLFDKQIIPDGEWIYYLLRCGRGFGKSFAGAAWVAKKKRQGARIIGLCGPSYDDVQKTMVPFILSWFLPDETEEKPFVDNVVRFKDGSRIYCYSSEVEKKGPNLEYLWCDEIATWCQGQPDKIKERFEDITRAVRVGKHPQTVITSTPKTHPFFLNFQEKIDGYHPAYKLVQGNMFDNPSLPKSYIDFQISEYGNNSRGRQEIYGDLITDASGAYWTHKLIDETRAQLPSSLFQAPAKSRIPTNEELMGLAPKVDIPRGTAHLVRLIIGFDPAVSIGADECGIVVVALYSNNHAYVLEDKSGMYDPATYSKLIDQLYRSYNANAVVVETNQGGNTLDFALRSVNALMKTIPVHVHQGKTTRAEHISALYSQGRVHHTNIFKQLEDQMCNFNINYKKSPDRLDALGLALTELFWPSSGVNSQTTIRNLMARNK